MFTYKFIKAPNGMLALQLYSNYKKTQLSLKVRVTDEELELAQSVKKRHEGCKVSELRGLLRNYAKYLDFIQEVGLPGKERLPEVQEVRRLFEKEFGFAPRKGSYEEEEEIGAFVKHYLQFMNGKSKRSTKDIYNQTLRKIRAYDPRVDQKDFSEIDLKWLTDFHEFCARTLSKNARNIHLRNIRAVFNNALDYELTTAYPFRRFKIRPEKTRKRSLTVEELRRIFDYSVEPYAKVYRDMFKLIFFLVGINVVDLWGLKEITAEGRIEYRRAKTGRLYSVKVEPEAMEIIEKYRGESGLLTIADRWSDHRNFRRQCNKALQHMGAKRSGLGGKKSEGFWPGLTTYWARHTWATIARSIGVSIDDIALALGHGDGHDLTRIYLDESLQKVDEANRKVLDYVLYGKR